MCTTLVNEFEDQVKTSIIESIFRNCARAYSLEEYKFNMNVLRSINPTIKDYLFLVNHLKWARSCFERKQYNVMTINIS